MAVSAPSLTEALAAIVGPERVRTDPAERTAAAVAGVVPHWIAAPASTDEVSRVLALASAERLAVAPRGSGSSLTLGAPPRRLDVVLDLRRLDAIVDYVPEDMVATVQGGATLAALAARLAPHRQQLPVDPPEGPARTIGGALATGAAGLLRHRYGTLRDLLLGVRFVQADGAVTWGGSRVVKSVTGYDVPKLLVGSLGTLGVIVEATLRLQPLPEREATWLAPFGAPEAAEDLIAGVLDSVLQPSRVALLNGRAARAAGASATTWAVAVSIASVEGAVRGQGESLVSMARARGATPVEVEMDTWSRLAGALRAPLRLKLSGLPARLVHWLGQLERRAVATGASVAAVGEAGSGVLRAAIDGVLTPGAWGRDLLLPLRAELAAEGGSVVVEAAPPELLAGVDPWGEVPAGALELMRRLKTEFDPLGVLNPGRFVGGL